MGAARLVESPRVPVEGLSMRPHSGPSSASDSGSRSTGPANAYCMSGRRRGAALSGLVSPQRCRGEVVPVARSGRARWPRQPGCHPATARSSAEGSAFRTPGIGSLWPGWSAWIYVTGGRQNELQACKLRAGYDHDANSRSLQRYRGAGEALRDSKGDGCDRRFGTPKWTSLVDSEPRCL
jgi:hypothetical protein